MNNPSHSIWQQIQHSQLSQVPDEEQMVRATTIFLIWGSITKQLTQKHLQVIDCVTKFCMNSPLTSKGNRIMVQIQFCEINAIWAAHQRELTQPSFGGGNTLPHPSPPPPPTAPCFSQWSETRSVRNWKGGGWSGQSHLPIHKNHKVKARQSSTDNTATIRTHRWRHIYIICATTSI